MTRIARFCQQNADSTERIALAYYQMRFWEEKRRAHQMVHGYLSEVFYESKLRKAHKSSASEYKRRVRFALRQIELQKANPLGRPVLP